MTDISREAVERLADKLVRGTITVAVLDASSAAILALREALDEMDRIVGYHQTRADKAEGERDELLSFTKQVADKSIAGFNNREHKLSYLEALAESILLKHEWKGWPNE